MYNKLEEIMKNKVSQYKIAAKSLKNKGIYIRGRSRIPIDGGNPLNIDIYMLIDNEVECIAYNITPHRGKKVIQYINNGIWQDIEPSIRQNYTTNGYNTRCGIFKAIKNIDRIKRIEKSHIDYMGCETGKSNIDHNNRVLMRNF